MNQGTGTAVSFVSGSSRATAAVILLGITVGLDLVAVGSDLAEIGLLSRVEAGAVVTMAEAEANDDRQAAIGLLQTAVLIATAIAFLMWLYRVRRNLTALGVKGLRFTPGWSVGWWFVPIMNVFRPFQIVNEAWQASDPGAAGDDWPSARYAPLIGGWWVLFVISGFVGNFAARMFLRGDTASELIAASWVYVGSEGLAIPAAILAILLVRGINRRQEEKHRHLAAGATPAQ